MTTIVTHEVDHEARLRRLQAEAQQTCEQRGHALRPWTASWRGWQGGRCSEAVCASCGRYVLVQSNPAPVRNGVYTTPGAEISGDASTVACIRLAEHNRRALRGK
jgi:hypothetical protein